MTGTTRVNSWITCKHPRQFFGQDQETDSVKYDAFFLLSPDGLLYQESNWPRQNNYYSTIDRVIYTCKNNIHTSYSIGLCQQNGTWSWTGGPPNCDEPADFYWIDENYVKLFGGIACSLLALIFLLLIIHTTRTWRKRLTCKCNHLHDHPAQFDRSVRRTAGKNLNRLSGIQALYENIEADEQSVHLSENRSLKYASGNRSNDSNHYDYIQSKDVQRGHYTSNPSGDTDFVTYDDIQGGRNKATGYSKQLVESTGNKTLAFEQNGQNKQSVGPEYAVVNKPRRQ